MGSKPQLYKHLSPDNNEFKGKIPKLQNQSSNQGSQVVTSCSRFHFTRPFWERLLWLYSPFYFPMPIKMPQCQQRSETTHFLSEHYTTLMWLQHFPSYSDDMWTLCLQKNEPNCFSLMCFQCIHLSQWIPTGGCQSQKCSNFTNSDLTWLTRHYERRDLNVTVDIINIFILRMDLMYVKVVAQTYRELSPDSSSSPQLHRGF